MEIASTIKIVVNECLWHIKNYSKYGGIVNINWSMCACVCVYHCLCLNLKIVGVLEKKFLSYVFIIKFQQSANIDGKNSPSSVRILVIKK